MADKQQFSSANKAISIAGGGQGASGLNAKSVLGSMTKDVRKRWAIVGTLTVIALACTSAWLSSGKQNAPAPVKKEQGQFDTTPKGLSSQKDWKAQTDAEMKAMKATMENSNRSNRELAATVEALRKQMSEAQTKGSTNNQSPQPQNPGVGLNLPPPPEPPRTLTQAGSSTVAAGSAAPGQLTPTPTAPAPAAPPVEVKRSAARSFIPVVTEASTADAAQTVTDEMVTNERRGYLPGGSFAAGTMISGVEAFTGGTAQAQPQPVVVRIDENAILPNAAKYQIKGCHVLASVWGDMSSERVFGRLATLTCVDSQNRLVLSEEIEGSLIDSDGKNGIRGALQDRQGAKLARSLLAGFAQGLSSAFGASTTTVASTALGQTSSIAPKDMARAGGYKGAETAANQLAEFYLKQAEATMPVIAVDSGRKISILFTKSKPLKFETVDLYRIKPKDKLNVERAL